MTLTKEKQTELAECLLDMGALLLDCGAEISRVEETLMRMGRAYGARHVDAFAITLYVPTSMGALSSSVQLSVPVCLK